MRFLHVADIHLDSPMQRLRRMDEEAPATLQNCTRRALENLVAFTIDPTNAIDFVVIAGDVFDGTWKDYQTGLFFQRQMMRLKDARIPVVAIRGNHDAQSKMIRDLADWRETIHFLEADRPQTLKGKDLGLEVDVLIHGQSFRDGAVPENLALAYPRGDRGAFNLGLLHTSFAGYEGHDTYAPCSLDDLRHKEYDYWALGHIHQRHSPEGRSEDARIRYAGNLQGRHIKEEGAKGALVVDVSPGGEVKTRFASFDVLRWKHLRVTVDPDRDRAGCLDQVEAALREAVEQREGRDLAIRVTISGRSSAHRQFAKDPEGVEGEVRALAGHVDRGALWIDEVRVRTQGVYDRSKLGRDDGPAGEIVRWFDEALADESMLADEEIGKLAKKLRSELRGAAARDDDVGELLSPEHLRRLLPQAEALLLDAVLGEDG